MNLQRLTFSLRGNKKGIKKSQRGAPVYLLAGSDRGELVRTAFDLMGDELRDGILSAENIFIHPNLVNSSRQAACTHVDAVRGVVEYCTLHTDKEVQVGDAAFHDTKEAFAAFDYDSLSRSGNVRLVDLNDDKTVRSYAYKSNMKKRRMEFSKTVADADMNIVVVPAKTHNYFGASLAVETQVVGSGVVRESAAGLHALWPILHTGYEQAHRTIADVYADHPADVAVIDGTQAMQGEGPNSGESLNLEWLIASRNPVSADALGAYLMGFDPEEIGYLRFLDKKGLGPIRREDINVIGANPETLRRNVKKPSSYPEIVDWLTEDQEKADPDKAPEVDM